MEWYTLKPLSNEFGGTLGGGNRAYLEVHVEAVIK